MQKVRKNHDPSDVLHTSKRTKLQVEYRYVSEMVPQFSEHHILSDWVNSIKINHLSKSALDVSTAEEWAARSDCEAI